MDHKARSLRRFEFYNEIKLKVKLHLGTTPRPIKQYQLVYEREVQKMRGKTASKTQFFNAVKNQDILFFGDFHSEPQSMRSLLRVCRQLKSTDFILLLECVLFKHQVFLDQFMYGEISESDFILKTNWSKNWNFPFDFVKPLFHWASQNKVRVFGINTAESHLRVRDQKIAENIQKIKSEHLQKLCVVQIGDYHLAKSHLPLVLKKIKPKLKIQTVFQSPDELYFKWIRSQKTVSDFIQLSSNRWAVMAVLPWVKWQNYLLWLESNLAFKQTRQFDKRKWQSDIDVTDHIARCVQFISEESHLPVDLSGLSIYSISDEQSMVDFKRLEPVVRSKIKIDLDRCKSFYIPELQKGYIENFSLNHICQLAAEYFLFQRKVYTRTISDPQKNFHGLIWLEMLTYFFTKLVNPKRKTNTVFDMRTFLMTENFDDHGKDVLSIALEQKLKEMNSSPNLSLKNKKNQSRSAKSYAAAARLLGGIMGEKVFWAYTNRQIELPKSETFLFHNIYHKSFQHKYYDLIEVIDHWPTVAQSKFDQF